MKKLLMFLLLCSTVFAIGAESGDIPTDENPDQPDTISNQARELILFDNKGFIFGSYMRVGLHMNSDANMLQGVGWWNVENGYNGQRFMNEGNYSEWLLAYESPRDDPSWWGGAYLRVAFDIPEFGEAWDNLSDENYGIILPEAFFRLGYSGQNWNFWLGRRYNEKVALNTMDYYVANLDGNGLGLENIKIGGNATMDFNWLFSYNSGNPVGSTGDELANLFTYPGKNTFGFVFRGIEAGPGSFTFYVVPSFQSGGEVATSSDEDTGIVDGTTNYPYGYGGFLTAKYELPHFFGVDGGTEFFASGGFGTGANQRADTDIDHYDVSDFSVLAGFQGYALVTDTISWRTTLYYEHRSYEELEKNFLSFGFRPLFRLAPIFGIQLEYDLEAAIDTGKLGNRITLAPTFLPRDGNTTSTLQIMPYITYGYGDFQGGDDIAVSDGNLNMFTWGIFGNVGF